MQSSKRLLLERLANFVHKRHPLPLDPRKSELLLRTLTESFQRHLDRHHPKHDAAHGSSLKPSVESSFTSVDKHVQSILTNPVMAGTPGVLDPLFSSLDIWSRSALGMIQDQLAHGKLSMKTFDTCLQVLWRDQARNEDMERMGVASKLVEWITASKQLYMATVLENKNCRVHLIDLLVRENQKALIFRWILHEDSDTPVTTAICIDFVKSEIRHKGLANAVRLLAPDLLSAHMISSHRSMVSKVLFTFYHAMLNISGAEPLELASYQQLRDDVLKRYLTVQNSASIHQAVLDLVHPNKPSADAAYAYLRQLPTSEAFQTNLKKEGWRIWHLTLCLNAARLLIADEKYAKAEDMMEFAKNFPKELELDNRAVPKTAQPVSQPTSKVEDPALLQRLDGLLAT